jgi:tetratricopeptide (TPR) repeat protein
MLVKCTSCGAPQNASTSQECSYCGNLIELEQAKSNYENAAQGEIGNLMAMAETSIEATNYEEALSYFNRVLEKEINNSDAWLGKGIAIVYTSKIGDIKTNEAIAYWKNAFKYSPNQDAMGKRIAKEINTVVNRFYPNIENHFLEFRNLDNSYKELVSRFTILEKAQDYATQLDSDNYELYNTGYSLCRRVVQIPKQFANSDRNKALIGGIASAFENNGYKGIKGNRNATIEYRSASDRKSEIMEYAQTIFNIEEKYVTKLNELNPKQHIISSKEEFENSPEGEKYKKTKQLEQTINNAAGELSQVFTLNGIKNLWTKATLLQKIVVIVIAVIILLFYSNR